MAKWKCIGCETGTHDSEIRCEVCGTDRPIKIYPLKKGQYEISFNDEKKLVVPWIYIKAKGLEHLIEG